MDNYHVSQEKRRIEIIMNMIEIDSQNKNEDYLETINHKDIFADYVEEYKACLDLLEKLKEENFSSLAIDEYNELRAKTRLSAMPLVDFNMMKGIEQTVTPTMPNATAKEDEPTPEVITAQPEDMIEEPIQSEEHNNISTQDAEIKKINEAIEKLRESYIKEKEQNPDVSSNNIDGNDILASNRDQFFALSDMYKMHKNNEITFQNYAKYNELRDKSGMGKIPENAFAMLVNSEQLRNQELDLIGKRMLEIENNFKNAKEGSFATANGTNIKVLEQDKEEYERLMEMKEICQNKSFLRRTNVFYYNELREKTSLGKLSDLEYYALVGEDLTRYKGNPQQQNDLTQENPAANIQNEGEQTMDDTPNPANNGETDSEKSPNGDSSDVEGESNPIDNEDLDIPNPLQDENSELDENGIEQPAGPDEEPVEVKKTSAWKWIKDHKKQILIALGITALSIALIVALTQLLPALAAAAKANEVALLSKEMLANGQLWHTLVGERAALHGANTALASKISGLTGLARDFEAARGMWTIGSQTLPIFAKNAAIEAAAATAKVSSITNATMGFGIGGIGALGAGLLWPNKKKKQNVETEKPTELSPEEVPALPPASNDFLSLEEIETRISNYSHGLPSLSPEDKEQTFNELKETITGANLPDDKKQELMDILNDIYVNNDEYEYNNGKNM